MDTTDTTTEEKAATPGLVVFDEPIKRGNTTIAEVTIRKPQPGELHGLSLRALLDMEVNEMRNALPRVTEPPLTKVEVSRCDAADFLQMTTELVSFLLPKAAKASATA